MKQKTRKSLVKKIRVTGSGKLKRRGTGQNHYNSRDTGKAGRAKKLDQSVPAATARSIKKVLL